MWKRKQLELEKTFSPRNYMNSIHLAPAVHYQLREAHTHSRWATVFLRLRFPPYCALLHDTPVLGERRKGLLKSGCRAQTIHEGLLILKSKPFTSWLSAENLCIVGHHSKVYHSSSPLVTCFLASSLMNQVNKQLIRASYVLLQRETNVWIIHNFLGQNIIYSVHTLLSCPH